MFLVCSVLTRTVGLFSKVENSRRIELETRRFLLPEKRGAHYLNKCKLGGVVFTHRPVGIDGCQGRYVLPYILTGILKKL